MSCHAEKRGLFKFVYIQVQWLPEKPSLSRSKSATKSDPAGKDGKEEHKDSEDDFSIGKSPLAKSFDSLARSLPFSDKFSKNRAAGREKARARRRLTYVIQKCTHLEDLDIMTEIIGHWLAGRKAEEAAQGLTTSASPSKQQAEPRYDEDFEEEFEIIHRHPQTEAQMSQNASGEAADDNPYAKIE